MQTIKLFQNQCHLLDQTTFILILPSRLFYKVDNRYHFINDDSNDNYLGRKILKIRQDFQLIDIPETLIWLSKNCNRKSFLEIQKNVFNCNLTDVFSVLIFSNVETNEYVKLHQELQYQKNRTELQSNELFK
ncbi:MAG: hypothetical protein ACJA1D_000182 [Polaribacter sp.]|jgi:hypothetical protein